MALDPSTICVIANPKSGRNSHDAQAIDTAMSVFGTATLRRWSEGEDMKDAVRKAVKDGFTTIVAAGGDGTVMGVANALVDTDVNLAVLPLGTFNYFARGLGLPQEPDDAARAILNGHPHRISVGAVNGTVFLNNASLGIYPAILKQRESVYERFGRRRVAAHWSVLKTFLRYRRPWRVTLEVDGERRQVSTPLIFVARSAYQLDRFGLPGSAEISDDDLVAFIAKADGRASLLKTTWRLLARKVQLGRDVDLLHVNEFTVETKKTSLLVAYDGEKARMDTPLKFEILRDALSIILPDEADRVETP